MEKILLSLLAIGNIAIAQVSNGLVADWNFNTGRSIDAVAPKVNGTASLISSIDDHFGNPGGAFGFTGGSTNSNINLGNHSKFNVVNGLTISAWINHNGSGDKAIVSKWANSANSDQYILFINSNNRIQFAVGSPGVSANGIVSTGAMLSTSQWYHIVATWDTSGTHIIYINGVKNTSTLLPSFKTINQATTPLYIGTQTPGTRNMRGGIDDIKLYNRVLDSAEIQLLYNQTNRIVSGLVSHFPFDSTYTTKDTLNYNDAAPTGLTYATDRLGNANGCLNISKDSTYLNFNDAYDNFSADDNVANNRKFAYSFWINFKNVNTSDYQIILAKSADAGCNSYERQYMLRLNAQNKLDITVHGTLTAGNNLSMYGSTVFNANQWYHVVFNYDHLNGMGINKFSLYVNGVQETITQGASVGSAVSTGMRNGAAPLAIGTYLNWNNNICNNVQRLNAYFDDLRIYNKTLTPSEVTALYGATTGFSEIATKELSIYPNPTNDVLNITTNRAIEIKIVNVLGEQVLSSKLTTNNNTLNVSELNSGVYFITTENGNYYQFIKVQ